MSGTGRTRRWHLNELPFALLVVLVILAVIAGLVVGARAGRLKAADRRKTSGSKTAGQRIGKRARALTTAGIVRLWKWNRARNKKRASGSASDDED